MAGSNGSNGSIGKAKVAHLRADLLQLYFPYDGFLCNFSRLVMSLTGARASLSYVWGVSLIPELHEPRYYHLASNIQVPPSNCDSNIPLKENVPA